METYFLALCRHAVRYHILVNPTGKDKKWQGVDWCVELNNLYTKVSAMGMQIRSLEGLVN